MLDTSVPYGGVDFTSEALTAKQDHVNAILPTMDDSSNYALVAAMEQAGVKLKAALFSVGYEPSAIHSPTWPALQGMYFLPLTRPFSLPNSGTEQMGAALTKYAHFTEGEFPSYGQDLAWLGCDLMIKGIQGTGQLPITINYSTVFGHDLPQCAWILQAQKSGFVPISSKPFCGTDYPGTSTNSSS